MQLFYTTTAGYDQPQPNPGVSLGGYKSSTPVGNDDFGNIFDDISVMAIKNGRDEYRAIILRNSYNQEVTDVTIKMVVPEDAICTFKIATTVLNGKDKYNKPFMENVMSPTNKPFNAQFVEMVDGAELLIPSMQPGEEVGIWIGRHIDVEKARLQYETVAEKDPDDPTGRRYRPVTFPTVESVDVEIGWN